MGMSASQARLLSLTSRMHDLEFEAQALQYSKLDLANIKSAAYDNYIEALDSTKIQMTMLTPEGNEYQDVTYRNLISQTTGATHSMYVVKDLNDRIILPEQIASHVIFEDLASYNGTQDQFLGIVGRFYLYAGRPDIDTMSDSDIIQEMRKDGNFNYWASIFSQIVNSKGIVPISSANASDRNWLNDALMSGDVQLYKMTNETQMSDGVSVNIFAKTSVALDQELVEVKNDELMQKRQN